MTIRAKTPPRRVIHLDLEPGSLLVMSYATQLHYTHGVPKFYATAMPTRGSAMPLLVKSHDGRPIKIELKSTDVIHSFWVPNLHGKKDAFPDHDSAIWLRADKEGTYDGQCAEFCGYQHAQMRLQVIAESEDKFQQWLQSARKNAPDPQTEAQKRGQQVFLGTTCVMCHTIQGTNAGARLGPNLTHVASRKRIAAGTLPNTKGHLAGWIVDPQKIKPGVRMPQNPLNPQDLNALLEYIESLK